MWLSWRDKLPCCKHQCDFYLLNVWFGPGRRVGKYGEERSVFYTRLCKCGKFRITGYRDGARLDGILPENIQALTDEQKRRYLFRHIPKHERQIKQQRCNKKFLDNCLVVGDRKFWENEVQINDPLWLTTPERKSHEVGR